MRAALRGDVIRIDNMVRLVRGGDIEKTDAPITKESTEKKQGKHGLGKQRTSKGSFMDNEDRNSDGKVSEDEFRGPTKHFDRMDKNGDGFITEEEAPSGPPPDRNK